MHEYKVLVRKTFFLCHIHIHLEPSILQPFFSGRYLRGSTFGNLDLATRIKCHAHTLVPCRGVLTMIKSGHNCTSSSELLPFDIPVAKNPAARAAMDGITAQDYIGEFTHHKKLVRSTIESSRGEGRSVVMCRFRASASCR